MKVVQKYLVQLNSIFVKLTAYTIIKEVVVMMDEIDEKAIDIFITKIGDTFALLS